MIEEEFKKVLLASGINFDQSTLLKLAKYKDLLQEYNQKFNLTAIITTEDIYLKHFLDSIIITKYFSISKDLEIADVGTGAGFPGLVLKIFNPDLKLYLIESNKKKCEFLNVVCRELSLDNVKIINSRAEDFAKNKLDSFDIVISRAVADLRVLSELCMPLLKTKGIFLAMKGKPSEEEKLSERIIKKLNGKIINIEKYQLPILNHERSLVVVEKCGLTPKGYPRSYDKIIKNH